MDQDQQPDNGSELEERREEDLSPQRLALNLVLQERDYQRKRWGTEHDKAHDATDWHTILSVYMGKLAQETPLYQQTGYDKEKAIKRLAQMSAIAMSAVEALSSPASTDTA